MYRKPTYVSQLICKRGLRSVHVRFFSPGDRPYSSSQRRPSSVLMDNGTRIAVPVGQHSGGYVRGFGLQQHSGCTVYGEPPTGFEGMASPHHQTAVSKQDGSGNYFAVTVVLRIFSLLLALIALALIISANDSHEYYVDEGILSVDGKALRTRPSQYLVAIGALVSLYEVVLLLFSCVTRGQKTSYGGTLCTFVGDQVLAYLMFSAATAAGNEIASLRHGDGTAGSSFPCTATEWNSFCMKQEGGAAMGFLAFSTLALLALFAGRTFSRHLS